MLNSCRSRFPFFNDSISHDRNRTSPAFCYSAAMRSGNDRFPHGGISIVSSSVTRFDTPKINSPVDLAEDRDSARAKDRRREGKREKRGRRTR